MYSSHGGKDPGAVGNNLQEKAINLSVGLKVKKLLEDRGVVVKMSRTDDSFPELSYRAYSANEWGADCFLSIHCNSATASAQGVETYCYTTGNDALAQAVQSSIIADKNIWIKNRGVKRGNFLVVRETKMVAALVELAFISNSSDAAILKNKQDAMATAIAKGIIKHLGCSWDNVGAPPTGWEQGAVGEYDPATKWIGQAYNLGGDTLNIRSGAGTGNSIVTKISEGTKVNVYEVLSNGWLRVKVPNGTIGYCHGNYIKRVADAPPKPNTEDPQQPPKQYKYNVIAFQSGNKTDAENEYYKIKEVYKYTNAVIQSRTL